MLWGQGIPVRCFIRFCATLPSSKLRGKTDHGGGSGSSFKASRAPHIHHFWVMKHFREGERRGHTNTLSLRLRSMTRRNYQRCARVQQNLGLIRGPVGRSRKCPPTGITMSRSAPSLLVTCPDLRRALG